MTHGTGFLASYSSFEAVIAGLHPRFGRFLCSLLRTAAATLGVRVTRGWLSFTDSCSPVRERPGLFWRLFNYVGGFPALPHDADLALGVGANFPGDLGRISKGS